MFSERHLISSGRFERCTEVIGVAEVDAWDLIIQANLVFRRTNLDQELTSWRSPAQDKIKNWSMRNFNTRVDQEKKTLGLQHITGIRSDPRVDQDLTSEELYHKIEPRSGTLKTYDLFTQPNLSFKENQSVQRTDPWGTPLQDWNKNRLLSIPNTRFLK